MIDAEARRRRRATLRGLVAGTLALAIAAAAPAAVAVTTTSWADWTGLAGSAGAFSGSVSTTTTPPLSATFTSDSRGGQVGVISGDSVWLAAGTPVGAKYGSSQGEEYLNLRPRADTATGASTTTYTFSSPTPTTGWAFVLGDIDADQVTIRAVGPTGAELSASALGFQGGFNYCAPGLAGKPSCTGLPTDIPTWDAATRTLMGNPGATDTSGAAAWFEPSEPISSLTFTFLRRSGFPVYQTWFVSLARDISGTVTDIADGLTPGVPVRLIDAEGTVIAETATDGSGAYLFEGVLATDGYTVEIDPPAGKTGVTGTRLPADLTTTDAVVPFEIRDIVPVPVSGTITDTGGNPIAGVTVTITGDGGTFTAVTGSDGSYLVDNVPVGTYQATIVSPDGYTLSESPGPFTIPVDSETPITDQDFVLAVNPTLSGQVTAGGIGVAGVTVTAASGDRTYSTVTGADGSYSFPRIDPGDYDVSIVPPAGYTPTSPISRTETVAAADVPDVDFSLAKAGVIAGTVVDDSGSPISGVTITVEGPGGPFTVVTNEVGEYDLDDLPPGTYTVTVTPPSGYLPDGPTVRTVVITDAGNTADASFELALAPSPSPTLTPTPTPTTFEPGPDPDPSASGPSNPDLAGTGTDPTLPLGIGASLLVVGAIALLAAQAVRVRRR